MRAAVRPRAPRSVPRSIETLVTALSDTTEQPLATEITAELFELVEEPAHVAPSAAATEPAESVVLLQPDAVELEAGPVEAEQAENSAVAAHPALPPPPPIPSSVGLRADARPNVIAPPRTFTTTASDWPIAQVPSAPTLLLPEFGDRPHGAPDPTRFSLPAFLPPPGMLFEASNGNAIVAEERSPESAAEPPLAFAASIAPLQEPASLEPALFAPASFAPTALVSESANAAVIDDLAAPMDAAFAELDELNPPDFRPSFLPRSLVQNFPRWACFAAGIGLGVVVTLIVT